MDLIQYHMTHLTQHPEVMKRKERGEEVREGEEDGERGRGRRGRGRREKKR